MFRLFCFLAVLTIAASPGSAAQAQETSVPRLDRPLRIYFDCRGGGCDFDYFRTEAPFVDYVRDRVDSDFHVMVLQQGIGGGGDEYEIRLIGSGPFAGVQETYYFRSDRNDTFDEIREGMLQVFLMGIMPYVARTPQAAGVRISASTRPSREPQAVEIDDPWNLWVFNVRTSGSLESEEQQDEFEVDGAFSANRTTADWKINFNLDGRLQRREFTLSDGRVVVSDRRNWDGEVLLVRSMNGHWSMGTLSRIGSSTQDNQRLRGRVASATEYNLFPYAESTERQFTILYSVGVTAVDYMEETIFEQTAETLTDHAINVAYELRRPWGFANASLDASHYLHDFSKNRVDVQARASFRIFRGLSFNVNGNATRIRDQLYLPRGEATDEEILTEQRQLATGYRYRASIGLGYNFGSIFNTVVNPRFTGSNRRF